MTKKTVGRWLLAATAAAAFAGPAFSQCTTVVADLLVYKSGPAQSPADSDVAYSVTIANLGPCGAPTVVLSDPIPGTMTFVSQTQDSGPAFSCAALTVGAGGTVSCSIATLAAGASATFTFVFHIPAGTPPLTYFVNVATGSWTPPQTEPPSGDPDLDNDAGSATTGTPPPPTADVGVAKAAPLSAGPDADVAWSLVVTNGGPAAAAGVSLQDTLPGTMTFVSLTQTSGPATVCSTPAVGTGGLISCPIGSLLAGTSASFDLIGHIPAGTASGTVYANTATVTSDTETVPDPNNENQSSTADVTVSAVDVSIVKTGPATAAAGTIISYVLTVANSGPDAASGVQFTDPLPPGTTFVSLTQDTGPAASCSVPLAGANGLVACNFAALASGASAQFTLSIDTGSASAYTNTASVTTSSFDTNAANNSSSAATTVSQSADLSVTKTGPPSVSAGGNVTYTIVAGNAGPSNATNVSLSDALPAGTTFVSATQTSGPSFSCLTPAVGAGGTITCTIATLPAGGSATFTIVLAVTLSVNGTLDNTASAGATTGDPTASNNGSTASAAVNAAPAVTEIPTLSPWAIGLLGAALAAAALVLLRR